LREIPAPLEVKNAEALQELLHSDDHYCIERTTALGSFDIDRVKVLGRELCPKEIASVVSGDIRSYIEEPERWILKTDEELS
jgi:hypothetical protein